MKLLKFLFFPVLLFISASVFASEGVLELTDGKRKLEVPIEEVRDQAKMEFTIYAPFRGREVRMKGILLDDLLKHYLSRIPKQIKLIAIDGYEVTFADWQPDHWIVVTHEDDNPLSLRNHGPLRLVEVSLGDKNPNNLRNFNDWLWMLQRIEILP